MSANIQDANALLIAMTLSPRRRSKSNPVNDGPPPIMKHRCPFHDPSGRSRSRFRDWFRFRFRFAARNLNPRSHVDIFPISNYLALCQTLGRSRSSFIRRLMTSFFQKIPIFAHIFNLVPEDPNHISYNLFTESPKIPHSLQKKGRGFSPPPLEFPLLSTATSLRT